MSSEFVIDGYYKQIQELLLERDALKAERDAWKDEASKDILVIKDLRSEVELLHLRIEEAFGSGFYASETYNATDAWGEEKVWLMRPVK